MLDWIYCPESSNIARFAYDEANSVLWVEFISGGAYQYFDVPESIFRSMKSAESKGRFLATNVKGSFRYAKA